MLTSIWEFNKKASKPKVKEELPKTQLLAPLLDKYLEDQQPDLEGGHRRGFVFHPSQITRDACPRKLQIEFLTNAIGNNWIVGAKPIDGRLRRIFDNGTMTHRRLQKYLKDMSAFPEYGVNLVQEEAPIFEPIYRIGGHTDGIIEINGERFILEIKTINSYGFNKLKEPYAKHVDQAHLYMYCTGIKKALFFYEDKNTQKVKDFVVDFDPVIMSIILEKLGAIKEAIINKRLVESEYLTCNKCDFKDICKMSWEDLFKPGYFDWEKGEWIDAE